MWWGKVRTKHFLTTSCNDQVLLDTKCRIKCEQHSVPNVPIINTNTRINCEHSVKILYSAELFSLVELSYTCPDHPLPPISLSHWTRQSWSYCQKHQSAQKKHAYIQDNAKQAIRLYSTRNLINNINFSLPVLQFVWHFKHIWFLLTDLIQFLQVKQMSINVLIYLQR